MRPHAATSRESDTLLTALAGVLSTKSVRAAESNTAVIVVPAHCGRRCVTKPQAWQIT